MSAKKQLAAVTKAADELEMQLRRMASLVGELQEAEVRREFERNSHAAFNVDGTPTVWIGDGVAPGRGEKFSKMVEELMEEDGIPETKEKVVRMWRVEMLKAVQRFDHWLAVNGGEAKR